MVEEVSELIDGLRREGSRRSVDADNDHGSRLTADEFNWIGDSDSRIGIDKTVTHDQCISNSVEVC